MVSWLIILGGLWASWHFTDFASNETFPGLIAPLMIGIFLIALLIKLVFSGAGGRGSNSGSDGGYFGGYFGGSDGDGGGDCGGGGD